MKTLLAVVFALSLPLAAAAQDQDASAPSAPPMPPGGPSAPPGAMGMAATNALKLVDEAIRDLAANVARFEECTAAQEYLKRDLAETKARLESRGGGKVPSNQAGLLVIKTKRLGRQQEDCIEQAKTLDDHFTMAVRSIASIQPPNHKGIPPRRLKILKLREKFTAAMKTIGGKAAQRVQGSGDGSRGDSGR